MSSLKRCKLGLSRIQIAFGGLEFRFEELLHGCRLARACLPELLNRQLDLLAEQFLRIVRDESVVTETLTRSPIGITRHGNAVQEFRGRHLDPESPRAFAGQWPGSAR